MTTILDWHNLYKQGWKGEIVPDAFQHPAKYARRLIAEIYNHLFAEGLIQRGDSIVDPFGGVALGALDAMRLGLHWTGCELEPKFVHLGRANIELWNARYSTMPNWGSARLLQGDSRNLAAIVGAAKACVSSPPYADQPINPGNVGNRMVKERWGKGIGLAAHNNGYGKEIGNLGNLREGDFAAAISPPPFVESLASGEITGKMLDDLTRTGHKPSASGHSADYGASNGQLGAMPAGEFQAVVSSPPYEEARIGDSSGAANVGHGENYGQSAGQLGSMAGGDFRAAVSSPPFESSLDHSMAASSALRHEIAKARGITNTEFVTAIDAKRAGGIIPTYGDTAGNIGEDSGETFWLAARQIVAQTYSILAPGGVAAFVCKDFVRAKQRVPFCAQWLQLCEAVGFRHLYTARAWLVEDDGTQLAHDGNHKNLRKSRKSFFRRLGERNTAYNNFWDSLPTSARRGWVSIATRDLWDEYNRLPKEEKQERREDGTLKYEPPTERTILQLARRTAFGVSGERIDRWNDTTRIDFEEVIFMVK